MTKIEELKKAKARRKKILKLRNQNWTLFELSLYEGVSCARISQLLKQAKEEK